MTSRPDVPPPPRPAGRRSQPNGTPSGAAPAGPSRRPNLTGDLDTMLGGGPAFRSAVRGYDRLQVDNYVTWVESELVTARREVEDLSTRYASCLTELDRSRRLLASSPQGREMTRVSERIGKMLRMAADEAADMTAQAAEEADRIVREARTEADALLRKARGVKEAAVVAGDRIRQEARETRAEAMAVLERARHEAAELLQAAGEERRRLDEQTDQARACLREVTEEIAAAIAAITEDVRRDFGGPGEEVPLPHRFRDNSVQPLPAPGASGDDEPATVPTPADAAEV